MKHIFKISALALTFLSIIGLAGCTHEEIETDQLSDTQVRLGAFAPNPVARGGALRILGSNLQNVQQVEIPGVEPITDIEVVASGRVSEIRVIVPVDGPEVGPISIVAGDTRLTSKAELEYSEPILFESFSPASAMPGDVITIKGDYLSNIRQVTFEGGAVVTEFESQSRYELKVKVPSQAITGKFILGDVDEQNNPEGLVANLFYSETELEIGEPTVTSAERGMLKAEDEVVVAGNYLDMIKTVKFADVESEFVLSADGKSLTTLLPDTASDGDIVLVSYAGKEFNAGAYTTVVPSDLTVAAETRFKAGLNVLISGKDLDLVTGAAMGEVALETTIDETSGDISFVIPETAVDGAVTLSLANGKTVETEALELVKPVIESVSPMELYAGDENIIVSGKDLDLVASAELGGKPVEIKEGANETSLELVTEVSSVSGKIVLTLANGVTVESENEVTVKYHSLIIVEDMPSAQHIGEEVVLKGSNFDLVENIFVGEEKVTKYSLRTATEVKFMMPWNSIGMYNIRFDLFNGESETLATPIEVLLERNFVNAWTGNTAVSWSGGALQDLSWGKYDWSSVGVGSTILATIEVTSDSAQIRFGNGSWSALPTTKTFSNSDAEGNLAITKGTTTVAVKLSAEDLAELVNNGGLVVCGDGYTLTSIDIVTEISQEKVIFEGPVSMTWDDNGRFGLALSYFEDLAAGSKMCIYLSQSDAWGQVQFNDGTWANEGIVFPELNGAILNTDIIGDKSVTKFELTLTQEILDRIKEKKGDYFGLNTQYQGNGEVAFVIQGSDLIINKITIL